MLKGGGIKPTYKKSLLVETYGDDRIDALVASARAGELGNIVPMIRHASGRITNQGDFFFQELEWACQMANKDERWTFLVDNVKADLPDVMEHYFG
jgi:hypothetical protein